MNPFSYGKIAKKNFWGREKEISLLSRYIESGQNVYLYGKRRIGKTSLIFKVLDSAKKKHVFVDLYGVSDERDLLNRMIKSLVKTQKNLLSWEKILSIFKRFSPTLSIDPLTGENEFSFKISETDLDSIELFFDEIEKMAKDNSIVVVFDEFQDIKRLKKSGSILGRFRAKIQQQEGIPYIFSGSDRGELYKIFSSPDDAFYKSAFPMKLERLDLKTVKKEIKKLLKERNIKIDDKVFSKTMELTNSTGDLIQVFFSLYLNLEGGSISLEDLKEAFSFIYSIEEKEYKTIWTSLKDNEKEILRHLSRNEESNISKNFLKKTDIHRTQIKRSLESLQEKKIITKDDNYEIYSPFFKEWIKGV
tara:strand:- start:4631 stop:5713 length:1083 start_codon:yes stop_codon:yes gene_type:complete